MTQSNTQRESEVAEALSAGASRSSWRVVGSSFVILSLIGGLTFYSMSAYIDALVRDRGFSLQIASAGPTMSAVFGGIGGLATARLMISWPTRAIMAVGGLGLAASIAGIGTSASIWQLWLSFAAMGLFSSMCSVIPVSSLVARCFPASPAGPLTYAMTGLAVGGAAIPPIVLTVLGGLGLARGSVVLGATLIAVVGLALLVLEEPPRSPRATSTSAVGPVLHERPSLRDKRFVLIFIGMLCMFMSQVGTSAHIVRLPADSGIGGASAVLSLLAVGSICGRLLGIPVLPRVGLRALAVGVGLVQAVAQLVLAAWTTEPGLFVGTYLLGLAMGNVGILQSLFAIEAFGLPTYPWIFARINLADPLGAGLGPLTVALMYGWFEGYRWPLVVMGVASVVGAASLFAVGVDTPHSSKWRNVFARSRSAG